MGAKTLRESFFSFQIWSGVHGLASLALAGRLKAGAVLGLITIEECEDVETLALKVVDQLSTSMFEGLKV